MSEFILKARSKARKHLTVLMSTKGEFSYLRLGIDEIRYLLELSAPLTGLAPWHADRFRAAYQNCSYFDLKMNEAYNREKWPELDLKPSSRTYVNDSPDTGNIIRDWTYHEFCNYVSKKRCLIVAAEAALLRELYRNPKYRRAAQRYWPKDTQVFFLQVRDYGRNLEQNLDLIKADIIKMVKEKAIETVFLSLGGGAKILCYEIAKELKITTVDWGSLPRGLAYSGSRGDRHFRDYTPYLFRIPFNIYMQALETAHPELETHDLIARAHAQLQLEMNRRKLMVGKIVLDFSPENIKDFYESLMMYETDWLPRAIKDKHSRRLVLEFEVWRIKNGLSLLGRLLKPIIPLWLLLKKQLMITYQTPRQLAKRVLPRKVKTAINDILTEINLQFLNRKKALKLLGLKRFLKDDVFIVSYPRSGNTWVRFLIANMIYPGKIITFRNINSFVPDLYVSKERANSLKSPRFLKTHLPLYDYFPRFIYIYRDGRDALVSHYYYLVENGWFDGSFFEFLHRRLRGNQRFEHMTPWHKHVDRAIDFAHQFPKRVLLLQYEEMRNSPFESAQKIAQFCRLDVNKKTIKNAVKRCSFNNMQKIEKQYGSEDITKPKVRFFRSGQTGQWKKEVPASELQFLLSRSGLVLRRLGYIK